MLSHLSVDRFEGRRRELAVLLTEDGRTILVPRAFLPTGTRAGEALTMRIERDPRATAEVEEAAKAVREHLEKSDPGGDIRL